MSIDEKVAALLASNPRLSKAAADADTGPLVMAMLRGYVGGIEVAIDLVEAYAAALETVDKPKPSFAAVALRDFAAALRLAQTDERATPPTWN